MRPSVCLLATAGLAVASTQECPGGAVEEAGNWFCGVVSHILYQGIGGKGTFRTVTYMGDDGRCEMEDKPYSGPLAPLDEDLSIHIRGPFRLKEAAVYNPAPRKKKPGTTSRRTQNPLRFRSHGHLRREEREQWVTATIDGQVVSWVNNYLGPATATAAPSPPGQDSGGDSHAKGPIGNNGNNTLPTSSPDWHRIAYYNAEKQVADNIIFMGNYGGQGSGVWDAIWGNSLAFLNADGTGGANFPQILKDVYIPSNKEFSIFSAERCDDGCGFSRSPETAYSKPSNPSPPFSLPDSQGFAGANKVFLFHFKMPLDGVRGFNSDMSALWVLNGRIPRAAQYNACNCWVSGCGEVDMFEVLAPGDTKCKSTFHMANGPGSSDYFKRPVDKYIKIATVFDERTASVSIRVLPGETDFSEGLDAKTVRDWITDSNGTIRAV